MAINGDSDLIPIGSVYDNKGSALHRARPLEIRFTKDDDHYAYNPAAAYVAAVASAWSYSESDTLVGQMQDALRTSIEGHKFQASNPAMYLDTNAFLLRTTNRSGQRLGILVYRGTELTSIGDYLADANIQPVPFLSHIDQEAQVHSGFYFGMESVWLRVYQMLVDEFQKPPGERIEDLIITGHSLGAAMAVLTAAQISIEAESGEDKPTFELVRDALRGVYTFGQPALGNAAFCDWMKRKKLSPIVFRHAYARDLVSALPTRDLLGDFQHFDSPVFTAARGALSTWSRAARGKVFPVDGWFVLSLFAALADFVSTRIPWLQFALVKAGCTPWASVDDHSPTNYLRVSKTTHMTIPAENQLLTRATTNGSGNQPQTTAS